MNRRTHAYLLLLIVSIIWGFASPVVKFTLQWLDPWVFLAYRFTISSLIALIYFKTTKVEIPISPKKIWLTFWCGLLSTPVAIGLFFLALTKTSAITGSMLTTFGPLLLVLIGSIFFHDVVTRKEKTGLLITLAGTTLIVFSPLLGKGNGTALNMFEGNLLMIVATVVDILGAVLTKIALQNKVSLVFLSQSQFILGLALFLPYILFLYSPTEVWKMFTQAPLQAHLGVLFMAIFSGTIAYNLRNLAVSMIEISEVAIFNYLQPVWGAMLAAIWLRETITFPYLIGGLFIGLGILTANRQRKR